MQQLGEALMRAFSHLDERQFMVHGEWMLRMSQVELDTKLKTMVEETELAADEAGVAGVLCLSSIINHEHDIRYSIRVSFLCISNGQ